ncbi:hypothetical protein MKX01_003133 [Papaver californicum]|nr:hypothetical protein MKX01_003133 [Papaver californicum]
MAASSFISRTSSIFIRNFCKSTKSLNNISQSFSLPTSASSSSKSSNFFFQQTRISTHYRLRREALLLNTLHPFHSATAAAFLVSKLPTEVSSSNDAGVLTTSFNAFKNYVILSDLLSKPSLVKLRMSCITCLSNLS